MIIRGVTPTCACRKENQCFKSTKDIVKLICKECSYSPICGAGGGGGGGGIPFFLGGGGGWDGGSGGADIHYIRHGAAIASSPGPSLRGMENKNTLCMYQDVPPVNSLSNYVELIRFYCYLTLSFNSINTEFLCVVHSLILSIKASTARAAWVTGAAVLAPHR